MKKAVVFGTRPEIIKLSPLIRRLNQSDILIHTNQHYSPEMDSIFFKELKLRKPDYNLKVGSATQGKQTGRMLERVEEVLLNTNPDIVIVQGDTNSTLAGALAASKLNIKVAHIEAGLRSKDMRMPEEKNRIITDHISDFLFAPTPEAKENLLKEGLSSNKIFVVGNTITDVVAEATLFLNKKSRYQNFILLTLHRAENVDNKARLSYLINEINKIALEFNIIYPIHPRTEKRLREFGLRFNQNVKIINPQGYSDFLLLEKNANLILTDSGGIQEEACILKVPCITLRDNTERPETIKVGANKLMTNLKMDVKEMLQRRREWKNPYGKDVTNRIMNILERKI